MKAIKKENVHVNNRLTTVTVALLGIAATSFLRAQQPYKTPANPIKNMDVPGRTEQHRMLAALAGDWTIKGRTYKDCPYGEGTFTAKEHNELMRGGLFLVSRTQHSALFKNSNQIAFFGVDPTTKRFTYSMYS